MAGVLDAVRINGGDRKDETRMHVQTLRSIAVGQTVVCLRSDVRGKAGEITAIWQAEGPDIDTIEVVLTEGAFRGTRVTCEPAEVTTPERWPLFQQR